MLHTHTHCPRNECLPSKALHLSYGDRLSIFSLQNTDLWITANNALIDGKKITAPFSSQWKTAAYVSVTAHFVIPWLGKRGGENICSVLSCGHVKLWRRFQIHKTPKCGKNLTLPSMQISKCRLTDPTCTTKCTLTLTHTLLTWFYRGELTVRLNL